MSWAFFNLEYDFNFWKNLNSMPNIIIILMTILVLWTQLFKCSNFSREFEYCIIIFIAVLFGFMIGK